MTYKIGVTWRVTATNHVREEMVVDDLATGVGRAVIEGAPQNWNVAYIVITETSAAPQTREAGGGVLESASMNVAG
ncbi:MAG TPA: hypothetical protein VGX71_23845 [Pseudaminobacter sp.]|nr:hypothetical protein [Pseudaminobacter sp.]